MCALSPAELTQALKERARAIGFDLVGACPAVQPATWPFFRDWVAAGYCGEMGYLARHADARRDPGSILPGVRGILVVAVNYRTVEPVVPGPHQASVSRYAWGSDYHAIIRERLRSLGQLHRQLVPNERSRGVVDTAPLLEREFARLAGLGWIGKNTMLINQQYGSWLLLAALLTTAELAYDQPRETELCRNCRACLDACPTGALFEPYRLDARRCISYLSMEHAGDVGPDLRQAIGWRLFGCDACQEACPHNKRTPCSAAAEFQPRNGMNPVDLDALKSIDPAAFLARHGDTSLAWAGQERLLRNAAIIEEVNRTTRSPRDSSLPPTGPE
ncbi:MAG: tRNA epoxyqueuosine(34) reductase QueG [Patescibacteria group bacterium]|nr:tRNA epoxyqueuosine(34) reductase QueG [Patescibacteria group bacterium]